MSLFINKGDFIEIDGVLWKKDRIVTISRTTDEVLSLKFDNREIKELSYAEHGLDNGQASFEEFEEFVVTALKPSNITSSTSGGSTSVGDVTINSRNITVTTVKATSENPFVSVGEYFVLETTTESDGSKSIKGVTKDGQNFTSLPDYDYNLNTSKKINTSTKKIVSIIAETSTTILDENINREFVVIKNNTLGKVYISMTAPASENDAIMLLPSGNTIIKSYTGGIFSYAENSGDISVEEF